MEAVKIAMIEGLSGQQELGKAPSKIDISKILSRYGE